jgi:hypothetical protein
MRQALNSGGLNSLLNLAENIPVGNLIVVSEQEGLAQNYRDTVIALEG